MGPPPPLQLRLVLCRKPLELFQNNAQMRYENVKQDTERPSYRSWTRWVKDVSLQKS